EMLLLFAFFALQTNHISAQTCRPIELPPYASFIRVCGTNTGDNCYIDCEPGFNIVGSCFRVCRSNGDWSGTPTECINPSIRCSNLSPPDNGEITNSCQFLAGATCVFKCKDGFTLQGPNSIFCQKDGQWSTQLPVCRAAGCPPLTAPTNGGFSGGTCNTNVGTTCEFFCNQGYTLNGNQNVQCLPTNTWSGNVPTCTRNEFCPPISPPANGQFTEPCTQATNGRRCYIVCNREFSISGQPYILCGPNGQWSALPTCVRVACQSLNPPLNGKISNQCAPGRIGESCIYICDDGFRLTGPSTLTCLASFVWDNTPPSCVPLGCPAINAPANGYLSGNCNPSAPGQTCNVVCNEGFTAVGETTIQCLSNGQWSNSMAECVRRSCGILYAPRGGLFINSCNGCPQSCPGEVGQTCRLVCGEGYRLIGSGVTVCQAGTHQWQPSPSNCEEIVRSRSETQAAKRRTNG
ncbi:P-selectin-like protein, partial [Dinothrombium tinctorium]